MSAASRRGQGRGWGWRWGAPAVVAGLVIGLWYTVSYRLLTEDTRFLVPPPDAVLRGGFLDPFNRAELLDGLLLSAQVAMLGLALAAVVGMCLAITMSQARWLEGSVFPYLVLLQATPILVGPRHGAGRRYEPDRYRADLAGVRAQAPPGPGLEAVDRPAVHRQSPRRRRVVPQLDQAVPVGLDVHVIVDNSSTHSTAEIRRWLVRHPRFHLRFTPTSSSWLNLVKRRFAELTSKWLQRSTHRQVAELTSPSMPGSTPGMRTHGRSCGPRPLTTPSRASPDTFSESLIHDTSWLNPLPAG